MEPMKLQDFINDSLESLDDNLLYKKAGIAQMVWVRDTIGFLLGLREECYVHTTHTSKSVALPVYTYKSGDTTIHLRGNFYDWCVAIDSPLKLDRLPPWMLEACGTGFYEGINTTGCETFSIGSREKMFAILWWFKEIM